MTGTARYASITTHQGCEQGRRDDLESLGHVLMYFLRGRLPWQSLPAKTKKAKYRKIMEKKIETKLHDLCKGFPEEFAQLLQYCRNLKFDEEPDYQRLVQMFQTAYTSLGYDNDFLYDWTRMNKNKKTSSKYMKHPIYNETQREIQQQRLNKKQ